MKTSTTRSERIKLNASHFVEWETNAGVCHRVTGSFEACCSLFDALKPVMPRVSMSNIHSLNRKV